MAVVAKKKPEIDLAVVLGGGKGPSKKPSPFAELGGAGEEPEPAEPMGGEEESEDSESELPPGFQAAADEAFDTTSTPEERAAALHRAIKACGSY